MPLSSCPPTASKMSPEPATRSFTVLVTRIWPPAARAMTRAAITTAMPAAFPSAVSHSPRVDPSANRESDRLQRPDDLLCASDGPRRPIERDEKAVTGRVVLQPPIGLQQVPHDRVVLAHQLGPTAVPGPGQMPG